MTRKQIAGLLRAVAEWLERATQDEVTELTSGRSAFAAQARPQRSPRPQRQPPVRTGLDGVKRRLLEAKSVDEGLVILRDSGLAKSKGALRDLARSCDVGVRRSESTADLAHRIVSALVGSRIQAETMRSLPLEAGVKAPPDPS